LAITFNYELITDLTFVLRNASEEVYIKMNGLSSTSIISVQMLDMGAKCIIQSCIDSNEYTNLPEVQHSDCLWEDIKVSGVTMPEVTTNILSARFATPNLLYIKNTSTSNLRVKISLRGNR